MYETTIKVKSGRGFGVQTVNYLTLHTDYALNATCVFPVFQLQIVTTISLLTDH